MGETILLLDEPAPTAVAGAACFLAARGLRLTHRTPYSVAFAAPEAAAAGAPPHAGARARPGAGSATAGGGRVGAGSPGEGVLPPGTGQVAAVPVQLRPEWCRVWVTVNGGGPAGDGAAAYVAAQRERSARVAAAVRALEGGIYDEARWPAYEGPLRAALEKQGLDPAAVEARVAAFKKRWLALGRKAARSPDEAF